MKAKVNIFTLNQYNLLQDDRAEWANVLRVKMVVHSKITLQNRKYVLPKFDSDTDSKANCISHQYGSN